MVKDQYPEAVKEAVGSVLPVWLEALKTLLNTDPRADVENTPNWDGLAIRIQAFKVRAKSIASFAANRHTGSGHYPNILPSCPNSPSQRAALLRALLPFAPLPNIHTLLLEVRRVRSTVQRRRDHRAHTPRVPDA